MSRLNIKDNNITFKINEGDLFEVANEDGIGHYPISWVAAEYNGKYYIYPIHFLAKFVSHDEHGDHFVNSRELCNHFISDIKEYGSINLDKWELFVPQKFNLEAELHNEFELEQAERY